MRNDTDMEVFWDRLLNIRTTGRDDTRSDRFRYPYEPTPYRVLERLAASGMIRKEDILLDYGSGKGRVGLFLASQLGCRSYGVDFDERMIFTAEKNRLNAPSGRRVTFVRSDAAEYEVPPEVNRFFFFNPFAPEILEKVLARILDSWYASPRPLKLFFYYPSDDYIARLMQVDELEFYDELDLSDLYTEKDPRERILVFRTCM